MTKRLPGISLLVGLALLTSGCGGGTIPTAAPPPPAPGEEATEATTPAGETPEGATNVYVALFSPFAAVLLRSYHGRYPD